MVLYFMKIIIETPTIAYLDNTTNLEISELKKQFEYTNGKISELLKRHQQKNWWRKKDPDSYYDYETDLKSQLQENIIKKEGNRYLIRPGSIPYIKDINYSIENKVVYPSLTPIQWANKLEFLPYYYQKDSVDELLKINHGNVSLPTGTGKSLILLMLSQQIGKDVVVVTPSKSIFRELLNEFQYRLGKHKVGGFGDGLKDIKKPITIAIGKSITLIKPDTPEYHFFNKKKALLVDESHVFGADTLESVCHGVLADIPRRFFVSATQTRGDGSVKLLRSIIGKTVCEMSLREAISGGFLCPLQFYIKDIHSSSILIKKDPIECKRTHFLYNKEIAKFYANIANAMWNVNKESTLILVEELVQIKMLIDLLKVPYSYIHSGSKRDAESNGLEKVDLQHELEKFNSGQSKVLIGTRSISTGTNIYPTFNTCNWMGGSSEIVTKQGPMGRSTRWMKDKYAKFHKEKTHSKIWDVNVTNQKNRILENMLKNRIKCYKEAGSIIKYL